MKDSDSNMTLRAEERNGLWTPPRRDEPTPLSPATNCATPSPLTADDIRRTCEELASTVSPEVRGRWCIRARKNTLDNKVMPALLSHDKARALLLAPFCPLRVLPSVFVPDDEVWVTCQESDGTITSMKVYKVAEFLAEFERHLTPETPGESGPQPSP